MGNKTNRTRPAKRRSYHEKYKLTMDIVQLENVSQDPKLSDRLIKEKIQPPYISGPFSKVTANKKYCCGSLQSTVLSKFYYGMKAVSQSYFCHGAVSTLLSTSPHAGHFINVASTKVPWTTLYLILAAIVSAPIYCCMADRWGRRSGIFIVNLAQAALCVPLFLPPSEIGTIALHVLSGVAAGGLFTVVPIYVREINNDDLRGFALSLLMFMNTAGYLLYSYMDDALYFIMAQAFAKLAIMLYALKETPSYLVMVGKLESACISVGFFTGLRYDVPNPFMVKEIETLRRESERARSHGKLTLWTILKNDVYRDATKIGIMLYTTMVLCGSLVFLDQAQALKQLGFSDADDKTMILTSLVAGTFGTTYFIHICDRKNIITTSYAVMFLTCGVLAIYSQTSLMIPEKWHVVPIVALAVIVFAYGVGWGLPTIIMTDILNLEIRSTIMCLLFVYSQLVKLAHIYTFPYIKQYLSNDTIIYCFALANLTGGLYSLFRLPQIKGKTVREIERQLKRVPLIKFKTTAV